MTESVTHEQRMFSHCISVFFSLHVQETLREKLVKLQALMVEEKRLTRGERTTSLRFVVLVKSAVNF